MSGIWGETMHAVGWELFRITLRCFDKDDPALICKWNILQQPTARTERKLLQKQLQDLYSYELYSYSAYRTHTHARAKLKSKKSRHHELRAWKFAMVSVTNKMQRALKLQNPQIKHRQGSQSLDMHCVPLHMNCRSSRVAITKPHPSPKYTDLKCKM